jgi:hypothetical protein
VRDGGTGESSEGAVASGQGSKNSEQEAEETKRRQPVRHYFPLFSNKISFLFFKFHFFLLVLFLLSLAV